VKQTALDCAKAVCASWIETKGVLHMRNMTIGRFRTMTAGLALLVTAQGAQAQLYLTQPDFRSAPIAADDPLVGRPIPGANQAEYRAVLLWNLRAGLNVAALQCQFVPNGPGHPKESVLRAVANYNGILAHHAVELAAAYQALENYFKRIGGAAKGPRMFDDYTTVTYNNWSATQAIPGFCQTAASVGRTALATPKGELYLLAQRRMRELRNSLVAVADPAPALNPWGLRLAANFPPLAPQCYDKKDRLKKACGGSR
jgi:hypothetical protein